MHARPTAGRPSDERARLWCWRWLVALLATAVLAASGVPDAFADVPPAPAGPYLSWSGKPLDGATAPPPFTAALSNDAGITGEVTWLFDDAYVGKDATAPYEWAVTAPNGPHRLKARWSTGATTTAEVLASFTLGTVGPWVPPKPVYEEPAPALRQLWATSDNRRAPVPGLYDWSKAGFGGGTVLPGDANLRPDAACRISAAQLRSTFGVVPDDGVDDTNGLQRAVDQVKQQCSPTGAYTSESQILLPAGVLNVSHEISLDANYLIVRGAGSDAGTGTRLVYRPDANTRYDTITGDGTRWDVDAMSFQDANGGWLWPGRGLFRVQSRQVADRYQTQYAAAPANRKDLYQGTVNQHWVSGLRLRGKPNHAAFAARAGDKVVYLAADAPFDNLKVGGLVNVMAANSMSFYSQMQALPTSQPLQNLHMRQQMFMVTAGDPTGRTIVLDKPLEFDVPVTSTSDGSAPINGQVLESKLAPLVDPVVGVGIDNLYITQAEPALDRAQAQHNYGGALTYTYDNAGRVKTATTAGGRATSSAYNPNGQPSTVTRPVGSIHYDYDVLDRPTRVDYSDTTPDLAFTYDAAGRVARASNGTTTAALAYDRAGRTTTISRGSQTSTYGWDSSGRLGKRTLPDGRSQSYSYNADAQPAGMDLTGPGTSRHITYGYDAAGNLTTISRAGGPTTIRTVDAANQLTRLTHTAAGGTPLVDQALTWSTTGDPSSVVTKRGTATSSALYTYDVASRVTGICLPGSGTTCGATNPRTTYSYDANGNRTSTATSNAPNIADNKTTTYAYDSDDRSTSDAVNGSVQTSYTYDANGSATGQTGPAGIRSYTYGLDDNLYRAALEDGRVLTYGYDESGNRTSRSVNSTPDTSWTWDTLDPLPTRLSERTGAGTATHQWWTDPTSELGTGDVDTFDPANPQWLLGDYQGSITDTASATALTGSATLAPYGELLNSTGSGYATNPLRFHGQYQDNLTGLYDLRARDYSTTAGRFTASDPVAPAAGSAYTNTYHYGFDQPTALTDPSGGCPLCITAAIGAGVGAIGGGVDCVKNHHSCKKSMAAGAAAGAAVGSGAALIGGLGLGVGATVAADAAIAGGGAVAYGGGTAAWEGRPYSLGSGARDFVFGAALGIAGRAIGALFRTGLMRLTSNFAQVTSRRLSEAATSLGKVAQARPVEPNSVACSPSSSSKSLVPVGKSLGSVNDVMVNPRVLQGLSPAQVEGAIGKTPGWEVGALTRGRSAGGGWTYRERNAAGTDYTGRYIQWSPGSARHFDGVPYWKVSSGRGGTQRFPQ